MKQYYWCDGCHDRRCECNYSGDDVPKLCMFTNEYTASWHAGKNPEIDLNIEQFNLLKQQVEHFTYYRDDKSELQVTDELVTFFSNYTHHPIKQIKWGIGGTTDYEMGIDIYFEEEFDDKYKIDLTEKLSDYFNYNIYVV